MNGSPCTMRWRQRYITLISLFNLDPRSGWVVHTTPQTLYPLEWPCVRCTGGWVGPRASGCGWKTESLICMYLFMWCYNPVVMSTSNPLSSTQSLCFSYWYTIIINEPWTYLYFYCTIQNIINMKVFLYCFNLMHGLFWMAVCLS